MPNIYGNFVPGSDTVLLDNLKNTLKTAGWKLVTCGSGSLYSPYNAAGVTDVFSPGTGGWFVMKQPTITVGNPGTPGGREFLFSTIGTFKGVRYARYDSTGYITGGGSSTLPTATHDVIIPHITFGSSVTFTFRQHIVAQTSAPYAWVNHCWLNGGADTGSSVSTQLFFDACVPQIAGDPEPYIIGTCNTSFPSSNWQYTTVSQDSASSGVSFAYTWYGAGIVGSEQFAECIGACWAGQFSGGLAAPRNTGINPWTNKDEEMPVFWTGNTQRAGLRHPKGTGVMLRWTGTSRALGTAVNSKNRIIVQDISFDRDGTTPPYI